MLNPFVDLLSDLIKLYMFCLMAWTVLSTLIAFRIVNSNQQLVGSLMYGLDRLCKKPVRRVRRYLPNLGTLDLAPIVLLILLAFLRNALYHYLYNL